MKRQYWRLVAIGSVHLFAVQMVLPLLSPYFSSLGFSDSWISLVFGLFPLIVALSASAVGELSEQIGRSYTIKIALLLSGLAYGLYFWGFGWAIILARVIDAVAFITVSVLVMAKIQDILADAERGTFTGIHLSLETAVRMFAPLVGGFLADIWIGWPFLGSIGIFCALALTFRTTLHKKQEIIAVHPLKNAAAFIKNRELRPLAVLGPFVQVINPSFVIIFPLYIVHVLGLSYTHVGLATTCWAAGSLLQFAFGKVSDLVGRRKIIILGTLIRALSIGAVAFFSPGYWGLLVLVGLFGIGGALWNVTAWAYMSDIAERENMEGRVIGAYFSIAQPGQVVGYLLIAVLLLSLDYLSVLAVLAALSLFGVLVAAVLFLRTSKRGAN